MIEAARNNGKGVDDAAAVEEIFDSLTIHPTKYDVICARVIPAQPASAGSIPRVIEMVVCARVAYRHPIG